jgi:hypothetical protein
MERSNEQVQGQGYIREGQTRITNNYSIRTLYKTLHIPQGQGHWPEIAQQAEDVIKIYYIFLI